MHITSALLYRLSYPGTLEVQPTVDPATVRVPVSATAGPATPSAHHHGMRRRVHRLGGGYSSQAVARPFVSKIARRSASSSGVNGEKEVGTPRPPEHGVTVDSVGTELLVHEGAGEDLVGRRARQRAADPHENVAATLDPRSACLAECPPKAAP